MRPRTRPGHRRWTGPAPGGGPNGAEELRGGGTPGGARGGGGDGRIGGAGHTAMPRPGARHAAEPILQSALEKISGRIAVSEAARTTLVEHFGGDAVLIPNGVPVKKFEKADPLPGWPGAGGALGFLGRIDEPRKGLTVMLSAFAILAQQPPGPPLLIAGPGDAEGALARLPASLRPRGTMLGQVSEGDKIRVCHSV